MSRTVLHIVLALASLFVASSVCRAQYNPEINAYVALHKKTGPAFTARNGVEIINTDAHEETKDGAVEYRQQSDSLGFYYKAFNWVDIAYGTLKFAFNVYNTEEIARKRITAIVRLLDAWKEDMLRYGDLPREDVEFIKIGKDLYEAVKTDVEAIILTAGNITAYISLQLPCTTFSMLQDLKILNDCLEDIQKALNIAYSRVYQYMLMRHGWRWHVAYTPVDRTELSESAIGRWCRSTRESLGRSAASRLAEQ